MLAQAIIHNLTRAHIYRQTQATSTARSALALIRSMAALHTCITTRLDMAEMLPNEADMYSNVCGTFVVTESHDEVYR